jgi:hypothetical protein
MARRNLGALGSSKPMKRFESLAKAIKKENLAVIDRFFAEKEAERQTSGLSAADLALDHASEASREADLGHICAYDARRSRTLI